MTKIGVAKMLGFTCEITYKVLHYRLQLVPFISEFANQVTF